MSGGSKYSTNLAGNTMKRFILLFILFQAILVSAQTYDDRSSILEIGYGVAVPFGKFESSDISDSASGYATAGTNLNVMFSYLLNKSIGISAMISSAVNRLFTTGIKERYESYADKIEGDVSDISFEKW